MRNALVLVPLCIGLTSGFIVPTSTSEANKSSQSIETLKKVTISIDDEIIKNNSLEVTYNVLYSNNKTYDGAQRELYKEGSEENKTIDERSFILVNQWWREQSDKVHFHTKLPNSLLNDNSKKNSNLDVFREDPRVNIVSVMGTVHPKNFNEKQEHKAEYNEGRYKNNYMNTYRIENTMHSNQEARSQHHNENKEAHNKNLYVDFLKKSIIKSLVKSTENIALAENIKNKYSINLSNKNFTVFNKGNHKNSAKHKKQNISMQQKERYDNMPLYRNRMQQLMNDIDSEIVNEQKLFHLLLEEQIPYKQTVFKNYNTSSNQNGFKYCRKCVQLAVLSNHNIDMECQCKCGRYIHLKGRMEPKLYMRGKRWICQNIVRGYV